jgi:ubiquinone/menaquinone biosynthesis C-methylase UbiE
MSDWVGLGSRVSFTQGDATNLPFENQTFDAAMTIHVAMNIAAKDKMYLEARRVLKPGGGFWPKADIGECTARGPKTDFGVSITDVNRTRRSWTSVQLDFGAG